MAGNWQHGVLRLMRVKDHPVVVTGFEDLTPWYRRVDFDGGDFLEKVDLYPSIWVRFWVPSVRKPGLTVQRGYTLVHPDLSAGTFSIDFVLHEPDGAASAWARHVDLGAKVEISCTAKPLEMDPTVSTVALAGDTSALPAINSILESLPAATRARVFVEDGHPDRATLPLARVDNTVVTWLDPTEDGSGIAGALAGAGLDPAGTYVWTAGERSIVRAARRAVRQDMGVPTDRSFFQTYWIRGHKGD